MHHYTLKIWESSNSRPRTQEIGEQEPSDARAIAEESLDAVQPAASGGRIELYLTDKLERGEREGCVVHTEAGTEWRN